MKVVVSFDPDYGRACGADLGDAFWLVASDHNWALARRAWATGATDPNSAVFNASQDASFDDQAIERFENVDLHHPAWTEIEFVGVQLTDVLRLYFSESGASVPTGAGFVVKR